MNFKHLIILASTLVVTIIMFATFWYQCTDKNLGHITGWGLLLLELVLLLKYGTVSLIFLTERAERKGMLAGFISADILITVFTVTLNHPFPFAIICVQFAVLIAARHSRKSGYDNDLGNSYIF